MNRVYEQEDNPKQEEADVVRPTFKRVGKLPVLPATREECISAVRPCPVIRCRYWMQGKTYSCVLDAVDDHPNGMTLEEVGEELGVTRERIRQIESRAMKKVSIGCKSKSEEHSGYEELRVK